MSGHRRQRKERGTRQAKGVRSPTGRIAFVECATDAEVLEAARHGTFAVKLSDALWLHDWTEKQQIPLPNLAGAVLLLIAAEWGEARARKLLRDFADAVDLPVKMQGIVQ